MTRLPPTPANPRRGPQPRLVLQDAAVADLTALDVLDLDLEGTLHVSASFVKDVSLELATLRFRRILGSDQLLPQALRRVLRERVEDASIPVDVDAAARALERLFRPTWEEVLDQGE